MTCFGLIEGDGSKEPQAPANYWCSETKSCACVFLFVPVHKPLGTQKERGAQLREPPSALLLVSRDRVSALGWKKNLYLIPYNCMHVWHPFSILRQ